MNTINTTIISLSNYLFFYGFRVILGCIRKQNVKLELINRINENFISNESKILTKSNTGNNKNSIICKSNEISDEEDNNENRRSTSIKKTSFIDRMINYHYTCETKIIYENSLCSSEINTFK